MWENTGILPWRGKQTATPFDYSTSSNHSVQYNVSGLQDKIESQLDAMNVDRDVAVSRVDIIVHSMGGLIAHEFLDSASYRAADNYNGSAPLNSPPPSSGLAEKSQPLSLLSRNAEMSIDSRRTIKPIYLLGILLVPLPWPLMAQTGSGIEFVSPSIGQTVRPGETLAIQIAVDPSLDVDQVVIWPTFGRPLDPITSPYETTVTIPQGGGGHAALIAYAENSAERGHTVSTSIDISVVPDRPPVEMALYDKSMLFGTPSVKPQRISGSLRYPDGHWRSLWYPAYGVTYSSDDPNVATVDSSGTVTPVNPGRAFITVQVETLTQWVKATVRDPDSPPLAPLDHTSSVSIGASGFRVDPIGGHILQQVLISNPSASPLHSPLILVLENLADSVQLSNGAGKTRNIAPVGAPYVFIPVEEGMFRPGATAEVELRFLSPYDDAVRYDARVYAAAVGER